MNDTGPHNDPGEVRLLNPADVERLRRVFATTGDDLPRDIVVSASALAVTFSAYTGLRAGELRGLEMAT